MDLKEFQNSCLNEEDEIVVQKYLIDGSSFFFDTFFANSKEEFEFKKDVSKSLDAHLRDVVIVGSGKLGFSMKPDKVNTRYYPFKEFDFNYFKDNKRKKSDLDIAVISSSLFDSQLLSVYKHTQSYSLTSYTNDLKKSFAFYILKGWLRPNFLPIDYSITPFIDNVRNKYIKKYERDINISIYKSWYYFEQYHKNNIRTIKVNLLANN